MKDSFNANPRPHFVIVPLMAQGHMIPAVDMARLLADGGATISFITTPINAARIRPIIDRIHNSALPIRFIELRFPSAEAGIPEDCENFDLITSENLLKPFVEALPLLCPQLESYLQQSSTPKPDCIIADNWHYWTVEVARKFGIPRLVFHGQSCFSIYCSTVLRRRKMLDEIEDDFQVFELPEMPEKIEVMKAQVRRWVDSPDGYNIRQMFYAGEAAADGIVINTFDELEPWYIDSYRKKAIGKKVWTIGPLSLYNKHVEDRASRGKPSSIDGGVLLQWLNGKTSNSVILVSFGSISRNAFPQIIEIGYALEASKIPFIWVVKEADSAAAAAVGDIETDKWMSEFEERTRLTGLVIRGWAPQSVILSHEAVGGFMTHCGWNSTLEAIAAGVPMVTWPRFGDQFLNERMVVDVLKVGVAVGVKLPPTKVVMAAGEKGLRVVRREEVEEAVRKLMGRGEEAEERRKRVREFGVMASKAMEDGGSSFHNLKDLINFAASHST
ncbi:UDP-glycosyltransferase 73C6-like [Dendrobium catenatum]|uniref:UDP-glycosyltransferase 73C6-like n=1 Tax=Dendrobium catenatum TaxID=906689 RepID=UPI0009F483DA|nr:UDP-glycosyltransferase 73C6-like [Dendrobium catenatum]